MKITGKFTYEKFRSEDGYTISSFKTEDNEKITVVGYFEEIIKELDYEVEGEYDMHQRFGLQFKSSSYHIVPPKKYENIVSFLSSAYFETIGAKTAKKVVDALGEDCISKIAEDPSILEDIDISDKQKEVIAQGIKRIDPKYQESFELLLKSGLDISNANVVINKYKERLIDVINENPYKIVREIPVINFKMMDNLARVIGFDMTSIERASALLTRLVLDRCLVNGDSYTTKDELINNYVREGYHQDSFDEALNQAIKDNNLYEDSKRIFHYSQYDAEKYIAKKLLKLNSWNFENEPDYKLQDKYLKEIEKNRNIKFHSSQIEAITSFFENNISVITGGPGTGKTTIVEAICYLLKNVYNNEEITIVTPTGRSAKRIKELCNVDARTIHSLLRWDKHTNTFTMNEKNPLEKTMYIIDEFSMVDNWLFYKLLLASPKVERICFIGDNNQLPCVGIGNLLEQIIDSNKFKVTKLAYNYRQQMGNSIVDLADDVINDTIDFEKYKDNISFIELPPDEIKSKVVNIIKDLEPKDRYDLYDIQVLIPKYAGTLGIDNFNIELQNAFNSLESHDLDFDEIIEISKRDNNQFVKLRIGDKILQVKNQSEQNVFNGDIGFLEKFVVDEAIDKKHPQTVVDFGGFEVFYTYKELDNITLAYAMTIHKSQGSEYKYVILPMAYEYINMLNKRLIYTAITRAREHLFVVGSKDLFVKASKKTGIQRRSALIDFMEDE